MAEVKVNPEVKEESQEHIDAMVDKTEGKSTEPTGDGGEETLLAGKYKSEEDLAKGVLEALKKSNEGKSMEDIYKDLEKGIHNPTKEPESLELEEDVDGEDSKPEITDREDDALQKYFEKYQQNNLTEDDYNKLSEKGFSKNFVDRYMKGMQSEVTEYQEKLYEVTDGAEGYNEMAEWAKANLDQAEKKAFNNILNSGDLHSTRFAIEALYNRYKNVNPNEPNLLKGNKPSSSSSDMFESRQQLMDAISDSRYAKDPAYRKKVEQKLERSNIF